LIAAGTSAAILLLVLSAAVVVLVVVPPAVVVEAAFFVPPHAAARRATRGTSASNPTRVRLGRCMIHPFLRLKAGRQHSRVLSPQRSSRRSGLAGSTDQASSFSGASAPRR